jgi:hypothetical protein
MHWSAIEQDLALVRDHRATKHFNQSTLAGTVVADYSQDFAGAQFEISAIQSRHMSVPFGDGLSLEHHSTLRR